MQTTKLQKEQHTHNLLTACRKSHTSNAHRMILNSSINMEWRVWTICYLLFFRVI